MKRFIVCFFLLLFGLGSMISGSNGFQIKKVGSIGSNSKDYTFFKIRDAVFDENRNIYVGDTGGYFVAKYNREGKFVGRIGRYGQGPDDFLFISDLDYFNDKLYVWDIRNIRITVLNKDLKTIEYIKPDEHFFGMYVLKKKGFICTYPPDSSKKTGRLRVLDFHGKTKCDFFNKTQYGDYKAKKNDSQYVMIMGFSRIIYNLSPIKNEVIVCFMYPINPAKFFLFDINGKLKNRFTLNYDKKYNYQLGKLTFNEFGNIKFKKKNIYFSKISSIFIYKNKYIVFQKFLRIEPGMKENIDKTICFVLDKRGVLLEKIKLSKGLIFFSLTQDGYLLGTDKESDIPQIGIYKLAF